MKKFASALGAFLLLVACTQDGTRASKNENEVAKYEKDLAHYKEGLAQYESKHRGENARQLLVWQNDGAKHSVSRGKILGGRPDNMDSSDIDLILAVDKCAIRYEVDHRYSHYTFIAIDWSQTAKSASEALECIQPRVSGYFSAGIGSLDTAHEADESQFEALHSN